MDNKAKLLQQSIATVYSQNTTALMGSWACALCAFVMFWQTANPWILMIWSVCYATVSVIRIIDQHRFAKYQSEANLGFWARRLYKTCAISASLSGALLTYLAWNANDIQLTLIVVILAGLLTGAIVSYSTSTTAFLCVIVPFGIPPTLTLFLKGNSSLTLIGVLMLIWMFLLFRCSVRFKKIYHQSVETALANADLITTLQSRNQQVESLNKSLHDNVTVLENAQTELQTVSTTDFLTKIPNRRHFMSVLSLEWERACESQTELSLIICDVDFFKNYNDRYGHLEGDQVLFQVGQIIQSAALRPKDCSARYGGEEFAILLVNTSSESAHSIAEGARRNLERLQIRNLDSPISDYVTMSIGIASIIPTAADSSSWLIEHADRAMYTAKQRGRNQTVESYLSLQKTGTWPTPTL